MRAGRVQPVSLNRVRAPVELSLPAGNVSRVRQIPTRRRLRVAAAGLLIAGIVALAVNLRAAITSLPPIFPELHGVLHISTGTEAAPIADSRSDERSYVSRSGWLRIE